MIVYAKFTVTKEWLDRDCFNVDIPNLFNAQWSGLERSKESVNVYIDIFAYRLWKLLHFTYVEYIVILAVHFPSEEKKHKTLPQCQMP